MQSDRTFRNMPTKGQLSLLGEDLLRRRKDKQQMCMREQRPSAAALHSPPRRMSRGTSAPTGNCFSTSTTWRCVKFCTFWW